MTKNYFILTLLLLTLSCAEKYEDSIIEVIKYDKNLVDEIQTHYDSTYTEYPKRADFWTIDYFLTDSTTNKIMKDSIGNIVAIAKFKNEERIFAEEYYSNGQLIGKTNFSYGKIDGPSTFYYPDGRIKSTGQWKDYKQVGEWNNYSPSGQLETIEYYNDKGELEKTIK